MSTKRKNYFSCFNNMKKLKSTDTTGKFQNKIFMFILIFFLTFSDLLHEIQLKEEFCRLGKLAFEIVRTKFDRLEVENDLRHKQISELNDVWEKVGKQMGELTEKGRIIEFLVEKEQREINYIREMLRRNNAIPEDQEDEHDKGELGKKQNIYIFNVKYF